LAVLWFAGVGPFSGLLGFGVPSVLLGFGSVSGDVILPILPILSAMSQGHYFWPKKFMNFLQRFGDTGVYKLTTIS
jgi:hypothetical protein